MTEELVKKIEQSIKLLKSAGGGGKIVEIAYSGGKDSDVILQLAKESGINYRAIYRNTTIDPSGTINHVKENGAEILRPKKNFFTLLAENGFPNRFARFCCKFLKEYKVLDRSVIGVRKAESTRRKNAYTEPTECRFYGSKKEHVEAFYPILDWTDEDVVEFIKDRNIKVHPLYYSEDGTIDPKRRLGCLCCPMKYYKKRIDDFKHYPNYVKAYIRSIQKFIDSHPNNKTVQKYSNVYEWFYREVFFEKQKKFEEFKSQQLFDVDYKKLIEDYFNITL